MMLKKMLGVSAVIVATAVPATAGATLMTSDVGYTGARF